MGKPKVQKTNAMRELDSAHIAYTAHTYEVDERDLSGVHVAAQLGQNPSQVFKTLVTVAPTKEHIVCCIPVEAELDLKAVARAVGVKSLSMIHVKDLLAATGYVRGGCSPLGLKRRMRTVVDASACTWETVMVSGGKRGLQLELDPRDLIDHLSCMVEPITMEA